MSFVEIVLIAITLGVDAFSIAVVGGVCFKEIQLKQRLSLILHFGLFQLAMFLLGGCIGNTVLHYIQAVDHWVILLLLGFIGGKLIYDAYHEENEDKLQEEFFSEKNVLIMALATSIDALAVGLSFALINEALMFPAVVIGIVAALMTYIGIFLGNAFSKIINEIKKIQVAAGIVLICIGIKIFLEHIEIF